MTESKRKHLPDEPFGQHLAAKITLKRQHALGTQRSKSIPNHSDKTTLLKQPSD